MKSHNAVLAISTIILHIKGMEFTCGRRSIQPEKLISHGVESNPGEWPWHAAIFHIEVSQDMAYKCGGTVINSRSILTAAHCVYENDHVIIPERLLVYLGKNNLLLSGSGTEDFEVFKVIRHPNYALSDLSNDIAVLILATEATFSPFIQPICLWNSNRAHISQFDGKLGTVIGFGLTETDQISTTLRKAVIPIVSHSTCLKSDPEFFKTYLSNTRFCAGFRNGTGVCSGDSGGSLTLEENGVYYIRGVVSLTRQIKDKGSCKSDEYVIFTDVSSFLTWIVTVVPQLKQSQESVEMNQGVINDNNTSTATGKCKKEVNCYVIEDYENGLKCKVQIQLKSSEENCNIIFKEATNTNVIVLTLNGEMDAIPDLSNALQIFKNIEYLDVGFLEIKRVDRNRLAIVKQITWLSFYGNRISELSADTFDDMKKIKKLLLAANRLKDIHRDLFKELENLTQIWLQKNQIEVLPDGLFRNNHKLKEVFAGENKLKIIRIDFSNLPVLSEIDLRENKCIDEYCSVSNFCGTNSIEEMQNKIWDKC